MRLLYYIPLLLLLVLCMPARSQAQENVNAFSLPGKLAGQAERKLQAVQNGLTRKTQQYLRQWQRQEQKMRRKLERTNPQLAQRLFAASADSLQRIAASLQNPAGTNGTAGAYLPRLDTLQTMLAFLQQNPLLENGPAAKLQEAKKAAQQLSARLQQTAHIQQYLQERKEVLTQHLGSLPGFGKQLQKIKEQAYYYGQVVQEWKAVLNDPQKLEQKALQLLNRLPAFQTFMARNSQLARLFPGMGGGNGALTALPVGLQTRMQVSSLLQTQLSAGGPNAQQIMQQQVTNAMNQLNQLQAKLPGGSGSTAQLPNFQPNPMKHKRLINRLEPGFNLQFNKNSRYFPATANLGVQLRYVLGKNAGIGIGAAYKMGLGTGWKDIHITHNGLGLRSFFDWRFRGSIWFNAGAEINYATGFTNINELKQYNRWQGSALAGISKKFAIGKKMKGSVLLLYDFLYNRHIPATQPFVYRVIYNL